MIRPLKFDRFYVHDELTALLRDWADGRPDLAALESVGRSWEGRDIWLVTLTNTATGPAAEKPPTSSRRASTAPSGRPASRPCTWCTGC